MSRTPLALPLAFACLLVGGCTGGLLESHAPVPETFRLGGEPAAASEQRPATGDVAAPALTVARPRAALALDTDRIALVPGPSRFDYYAGVRWAEAAPQMLQQTLVAALSASGRYAGVYASPSRVPAELTLDVELRHFEAVASEAGAAPVVHVQLQASLVDARRTTRLASFVSEARVPAREARRAAIVAAFEQANAEVVADVVRRVGAVPAPAPVAGD